MLSIADSESAITVFDDNGVIIVALKRKGLLVRFVASESDSRCLVVLGTARIMWLHDDVWFEDWLLVLVLVLLAQQRQIDLMDFCLGLRLYWSDGCHRCNRCNLRLLLHIQQLRLRSLLWLRSFEKAISWMDRFRLLLFIDVLCRWNLIDGSVNLFMVDEETAIIRCYLISRLLFYLHVVPGRQRELVCWIPWQVLWCHIIYLLRQQYLLLLLNLLLCLHQYDSILWMLLRS